MKQLDDTEFEAKSYPIERVKFTQKLKDLGAKLVVPERKMRRALLQHEDHPQIKADYIRVRDEGDGVIRISAKTHAHEGGSLSDQKEIDITVNDYDKAIRLVEAMGFKFSSYQETLRETWQLDGAEIVIDTWPGLLTYTEVEATSEQHVKDIFEKLGLDWDKKMITSVTPIYAKVYHLDEGEVLKMLKVCTFEKNPFSQLTPDNSWI